MTVNNFSLLSKVVLVLLLFHFTKSDLPAVTLTELRNQIGDTESAEAIYNKTYAVRVTEMQKNLFKNYDKNTRPVRNQSMPTTVQIHPYFMHISVNEAEQTMELNGHFYMTWTDELLTWEPNDYNGVRQMISRQWKLWQPSLRITNSASGVGAYHSISRWSYALIVSHGKLYSRIDSWPTFSIKIGCSFDFSYYPYDVQRCPLIMHVTNRMPEVELSTYYGIQPTVLLGWGEQSAKKHVSDWEMVDINTSVSYYIGAGGKYTKEKPKNKADTDTSWTMLYTWITIRRYNPYFGVCVSLPAIVSAMLNCASFWTKSPDTGIYLLISNLFLEAVFTREMIMQLPVSIGGTPRIVKYSAVNAVFTLTALLCHLSLKSVRPRPVPLSLWMTRLISWVDDTLPWRLSPSHIHHNTINMDIPPGNNGDQQEQKDRVKARENMRNWFRFTATLRFIVAVIYVVFYFLLILILLT